MTAARLGLAIVALALALTLVKLTIVALVVAGLIFRPTTTIGLVAVFALLALARTYPAYLLATVALGLLTAVALKPRA